ncbi:hypothetical protein PSN01_04052 [Micromonospora saelicesensis]|nr:hypothetical protein PSN01_04052 [Micromonospora saelicesensis]
MTVRSESRCVHWRSGTASWKPAAASSAARREVNGPRYAVSVGERSRTIDSRGYGPSVSLSQTIRSGYLDRRLYGGACAAINRSSRTSASNEWAHSTASTRSAAPSISEIRARFSPAVK